MIPRPRGQLVRSFAERGRRKGGLVCARNASSLISPIYATGEMAETLMKNGKDVMHWIGCLANAAILLFFSSMLGCEGSQVEPMVSIPICLYSTYV